jgi:hypothetical protein
MSDTTAELGLKLAVDADDTADYLVTSLRNSLNVLDGVFSSSTGHNHNGAHQGGNLVFGVLNTTSIAFANGATLGPFATGNQLRFQSTNVSFSGTITADGAATVTGLTVNGNTTVTGTLGVTLDITCRDLTASRNTTINGTLGVTGAVATSNRITSGTDMVVGNGALFMHSSGDTSIVRQSPGALLMPNTLYIGATDTYIQRSAAIGSDPHPFIFNSTGSGLWILNNGLTFYTPSDPQGGGQSLRVISPSNRSAATYGGGEVHIALRLFVDGDIYSGTYVHGISFIQNSDMAIKQNAAIVSDADCMTRVRNPSLPVYSYEIPPPVEGGITPTPTDIGFSAADVHAVAPEFAALDENQQPVGVTYSNMAALLWGALRELDARCQAKGI